MMGMTAVEVAISVIDEGPTRYGAKANEAIDVNAVNDLWLLLLLPTSIEAPIREAKQRIQ